MVRAFHLRVASIIPTGRYVMATSVNAGEGSCADSWLAKTVSCRNGNLTSGHKMAKIGRFRAIWFRVIIVTGVHARKTSRAQQKGGYPRLATRVRPRAGRSDSIWPLTFLWPDLIIRGSCEFFPKTTYPSQVAIRNVAVSFAFMSLRTTLCFCPSRSASAMALCQSL